MINGSLVDVVAVECTEVKGANAAPEWQARSIREALVNEGFTLAAQSNFADRWISG